jgi:hypothetical protein
MTKEQANQQALILNNSLDRFSKSYYKVVFNVQSKKWEVVLLNWGGK